ncbi:protein-L-isoaspartate O-methyltransferase [Undibacterium sp. TS12]|uniref:protein-L-isoaspartate O-methyltransferase family protein n=1 Tax=Undibacterium sp. TS12 TaxID=2908202 RepID=UPI001F4D0626|nr:protein-L-isoaspartate O-methyltransferase [Undibacterium sp. TS12]MCH8619990.1 protein-L-isoaspartate O-methyltransferase [Undibacterium sp. TS12]
MNIEKARFNMIEQQIRPWNVLDQEVLDMLIVVKREEYFPAEQKSLAFFDTELPLPDGSKAMTPKLEARILQELGLKKQENVLLIGAGTGYLAAMLAYRARHVTVLESSKVLHELAAGNLHRNHVNNVDVVLADAFSEKNTGNYDAIVIAGGLESIPEHLQKQLNVGGRLLAFVGQLPTLTAELLTRASSSEIVKKNLFETVVAPAAGAKPVSHFSL